MSRNNSGQPSNPLTLSGAAAGWKNSAAMRWLLLLLFVFFVLLQSGSADRSGDVRHYA